MTFRLRLVPFPRPRDRAARLPGLVLVGAAVLLVALWDPVTTPAPTLCASRLALGLPCPLCGGTRGAATFLRGRPAEALTYNPLSVPAVVVAVGLTVLWSAEYLSGLRLVFDRPRWSSRAAWALLYAALLATWLYLLLFRVEDDFASSWLGRLVRAGWRPG